MGLASTTGGRAVKAVEASVGHVGSLMNSYQKRRRVSRENGQMQRASLITAAQQSALCRALEPQICPDITMRNGCARLSNDSTHRSDFWLPVSVVRLMRVQSGNLRCLPQDYKGERHIVIAKHLPSRNGQEWVEFEEVPGSEPNPPQEQQHRHQGSVPTLVSIMFV